MKNIVVVGGGTGTFTVLSGLKKYTRNLAAIVSMADSGGSTGILKDELGALPPGDIRRCLVALSNSDQLLRELFSYRFENGGLEGHSFGNLLITALEKITGSFEKAVEKAGEILAIEGKVIPVTTGKVELYARLENGRIIKGEANIDDPKHDGHLKIIEVFLRPNARVNKKAEDAIKRADLIVIGPGDLYTSVIPNLLVKGISRAIRRSRAKKVYVCNLMTKFGETHKYKTSDFVEAIEKYLGKNVLDYVIVNSKKPPKKLLLKYKKEKKALVEIDEEKFKDKKFLLIPAKVMSNKNLIRHDSDKLARLLLAVGELENVLKFINR